MLTAFVCYRIILSSLLCQGGLFDTIPACKHKYFSAFIVSWAFSSQHSSLGSFLPDIWRVVFALLNTGSLGEVFLLKPGYSPIRHNSL